jgi:putative endonuclease
VQYSSLRAKRSNPDSFREGSLDCFVASLLAMTVVDFACVSSSTMKQPYVYIFANRRNGTLYTGVTSNLPKRAYEHREGLVKGFSAKYGCKILVWYELHATMLDAITREKQIKAGSRANKLALIEALNPDWKDLYGTLI